MTIPMQTINAAQERGLHRHSVWARVARSLSALSTCTRGKNACVLLDTHSHVLATGYSGPPSNRRHCTDSPCAQVMDGPQNCDAVHAEINALMQCPDVSRVTFVYTVSFPCATCIRALLNASGCRSIYYSDELNVDPVAMQMWTRSNRIVFFIPNLS